MNSKLSFIKLTLLIIIIHPHSIYPQSKPVDLQVKLQFSLGSEIGKLRAIPVQLTENEEAFLFIYSKDKEIDPWIEMFYPPTDRLKMALYSKKGGIII